MSVSSASLASAGQHRHTGANTIAASGAIPRGRRRLAWKDSLLTRSLAVMSKSEPDLAGPPPPPPSAPP